MLSYITQENLKFSSFITCVLPPRSRLLCPPYIVTVPCLGVLRPATLSRILNLAEGVGKPINRDAPSSQRVPSLSFVKNSRGVRRRHEELPLAVQRPLGGPILRRILCGLRELVGSLFDLVEPCHGSGRHRMEGHADSGGARILHSAWEFLQLRVSSLYPHPISSGCSLGFSVRDLAEILAESTRVLQPGNLVREHPCVRCTQSLDQAVPGLFRAYVALSRVMPRLLEHVSKCSETAGLQSRFGQDRRGPDTGETVIVRRYIETSGQRLDSIRKLVTMTFAIITNCENCQLLS